jgi:transposase
VACRLGDLVPEDHILKRVDKEVDFSWFRDEVKGFYDENNGRPSIDPEAALRLMIAGFFAGISEDRKLMREAQVNIAMRWFAGYRLDERLPEHSSLTRIRQRWGEETFRKVFVKTVEQCDQKGLVGRETVHIDATLIRADVSWKSVTERHVEEVLKDNPGEQEGDKDKGAVVGEKADKKGKSKKYSPTDPDASMATSSKDYHLEPTYKSHVGVDDKAGVIVDVKVTTGEASEGKQLLEQIERVEATTGAKPRTVTADAGYAHACNYEGLEGKGIEGLIAPRRDSRKCSKIPLRRFKYNARHDIVRCPCGKTLKRGSRGKKGWVYRGSSKDCGRCALRPRCFGRTARVRTVLIVDGYEALLRGRRSKQKWDERQRELYDRHRWRIEGTHGEAKTRHGMRRAARRGLWNVSIQAYIVAAVINLKRLATAALAGLLGYLPRTRGVTSGRRRLSEALRPFKPCRQPGVALAA